LLVNQEGRHHNGMDMRIRDGEGGSSAALTGLSAQ
jgi:hypothetical protein